MRFVTRALFDATIHQCQYDPDGWHPLAEGRRPAAKENKGRGQRGPRKASLAPLWDRDIRGSGRFNFYLAFILTGGRRLG